MKADLLRAERIKRGWTQARVAEAVGVDARTVGRWERGKALPYPYFREQLCLLFGKTAQQLGLLSADRNTTFEDIASFGARSPAPAIPMQASFLADPSIPQSLESATSLVGRHGLLMEVKERLLAGEDVALRAVDGLPGIGKTALAAVLAMDQQIRDHFCDGILWAGLGPRPNVLGHLARWGMLLGVMPSQVENISSRESWSRALRAAIGSRRLLLIISDAWTAEEALSLQVGGIGCAHVVTTRLSEVALAFDQKGAITIGQLEETERIALLSRFVPELVEQDPQEAHALVEAVGGVPLTLTLMGSYLACQPFPAQPHPLQRALALLHDTEECLRVNVPRVPEQSSASLGDARFLNLYAAIAMCDQQLSPQAHAALCALCIFLPKPESFSEEAALAVTQQPVATLDMLCDAGLLEVWGLGRYFLHQVVADYVHVQGKVSAAQEQRMEDVDDLWLTNLFGEQGRNHLPAPVSANLVHEQHKSGIDKIDEIMWSLPKDTDKNEPLKRRKKPKESKYLWLVLFCLLIVSSGICAVFLPLRTSKSAESPSLIGCWSFNEGSGASTLDMSGNGNRAQINGATWSTGRFGNGLSFDGSSNTVDINRPIVDTSTSFTVSAWVLLSDLNKWYTAVSQDGNNVGGFYLQFTPRSDILSGQFAFSLVNSDSTTGTTIRATSNFEPMAHVWYHLVGVYDARAAQSSLYVNGVLRSTQMVPATWNASGETVIGRAKWGKAANFWSGKIDDVRLYNRALSTADVANLYASFGDDSP
ncbi:MAG TPA: LamG-like jellyroll fold domain-containing protein [Ktedonobacteraceae bacterium]